ncbi:MAG: hypothetical protein ACFFD4_07220 [Candidatus Odinarchaeota archaeon]
MEKNQRDAFITLLGGIGLIVMLMGIFTDWLEFEEAIIIAVAFWILTGVAGSMQSDSVDRNLKTGIVSFLGGAGLVVLIMGIFTDWLEFEIAIVIAMSIWVVTGALAAYIGEDDKTSQLRDRNYYTSPAPVYARSSPSHYSPDPEKVEMAPISKQAYYKPVSAKIESTSKYCRKCGNSVDVGSNFCFFCGSEVQ